jgi:putative peptide zinc metalloprotease protein
LTDQQVPQAPPESAPLAAPTSVPRPSDGLELLGEFKRSGFKEPPYLVRRADGQVIQLSKLLYAVVESADGQRDLDAIAASVSRDTGRGVRAEHVRFLVEERLRPLGVLAGSDETSSKLKRADPLLALKFRFPLLPGRAVQALAAHLRPMFLPTVIALEAGLALAFAVWMFFIHGIGAALVELVYHPSFILIAAGLAVLAAMFHEIGHATACRYGGAEPGVVGAGVYFIWPVFYTRVTDSYRLDRRGRLRTDLGGIYFNLVFLVVLGEVYFLTGFEPLIAAGALQFLQILYQLLPFLRFDGYYILSDLTGVPDLLSRVRPTVTSLRPGRQGTNRSDELKPWVRRVTKLYVVALVPTLAFFLAILAVRAPDVLAAAGESLPKYGDRASAAFSDGKVASGLVALLQVFLLVLPAIGLVLTTGRAAARVGTAVRRRRRIESRAATASSHVPRSSGA